MIGCAVGCVVDNEAVATLLGDVTPDVGWTTFIFTKRHHPKSPFLLIFGPFEKP